MQDAANCPLVVADATNYSAHYIGFDDRDNATTLFTTNYGAGLRVFDIHNPAQPKEIAYYHPVPNPNTAPANHPARIAFSLCNTEAEYSNLESFRALRISSISSTFSLG